MVSGVTSIERELGKIVDFDEVKKVIAKKFEEVFGADLYNSAGDIGAGVGSNLS